MAGRLVCTFCPDCPNLLCTLDFQLSLASACTMASIITNFPAISGGLPTQPDEAPSIVFSAAYGVLLFPTIWRVYTYRRPGSLLFTFVRLILFITIRIATFALRAQEAVTDLIPSNPVPDTGIFIAEQILLGIGFIVLVDLLVSLLESHIARTDVPEHGGKARSGSAELKMFISVLHVSLMAAIALGIASGALYSDALSDPAKATTVRDMRIASSTIALAVTGFTFLICVFMVIRWRHLGPIRTAYLMVTAALLLVVPAYRLSTSVSNHPSLSDLISSATRIKFYILQGLMEFVVCILLVAVDVRVWFFAGGKEAQMMLAGTHPRESRHRGNGAGSAPIQMEAKRSPV